MRSERTLRRWVKDLRTFIDEDGGAAGRIAYAVETALRVALSNRGDFRDYNPVQDAKDNAAEYLRATR